MEPQTDEDVWLSGATIENFMRVKLARIKFEKNGTTVIGGENGAGKTSLAKGIFMALAGKKKMPKDPIRHGAAEAKITLDLEPDFRVIATIKPGNEYTLELLDKEGMPYKRRPQERLDAFNAEYGFEVDKFRDLEGPEQKAILMKIVGVNLEQFERKRDGLSDRRKKLKDVLSEYQGQVAGAPEAPDGTPDEEVLTGEIIAEGEAANKLAREKQALLDAAARCDEDKIRNEQRRKDIEEESNELAAQRRELERRMLEGEEKCKKLAEEWLQIGENKKATLIEAEKVIVPDIDAVRLKFKNAEATNKNVRMKQERIKLEAKVTEFQDKVKELDTEIKAVDEEKNAALRNAKFPVKGLGFSDTGITLGGVPFEQASEAQQWEALVGIGFAKNPRLKLFWVRNGSLLTKATRRLVYDLVAQRGGQLIFEVVGEEDPDTTVLMVDGEASQSTLPNTHGTQEKYEEGDEIVDSSAGA